MKYFLFTIDESVIKINEKGTQNKIDQRTNADALKVIRAYDRTKVNN